MSIIFITATNTDVGKTFASKLLIETLAKIKPDIKVGGFKPIETGVISFPKDASLLFKISQKYNSDFLKLSNKEITSYSFKLPASPFVASGGQKLNINKIIRDIKKIEKLCDILIVEGVGGLKVPINIDYFVIDLIKEIADFTLLITSSKLGCINDTLLSIDALKERDINFDWCINMRGDEVRKDFQLITEPFYKAYFNKYWILENGISEFGEKLLKKFHLY